jgi:hypothetical protein
MEGRECYARRNRPGAATRGQQQPAVGHKSSKERPTRQGKSSQHSAAAAEGATGAGYPESGRKRDRRGEQRGGQAGQCGKEWEASWPSSACSYQQGLAPAGVDTRLAAGRAGRQSPQPSWSCWEPARAAASRAVCAAEGATHPLAHPGGSRWRNQLALRACQPQPQPAPVRATPARHRVGQEAAAQAAMQGSRWQGSRAMQGKVGKAQRRHKSKHRGVRKGREGERRGHKAGRGPLGVTHQVGVGLPRGGSPQKCQRQDQSR